jgi:hypothetical protein
VTSFGSALRVPSLDLQGENAIPGIGGLLVVSFLKALYRELELSSEC